MKFPKIPIEKLNDFSMEILGKIQKCSFGISLFKKIEAFDMLGVNFLRDDKLFLYQVSSYDFVYTAGVPENHLEHPRSHQHDARPKNPLFSL